MILRIPVVLTIAPTERMASDGPAEAPVAAGSATTEITGPDDVAVTLLTVPPVPEDDADTRLSGGKVVEYEPMRDVFPLLLFIAAAVTWTAL